LRNVFINIGTNIFLPSEYISEFHRYWKENHEKVLCPQIGANGECLKVAKVLEGINPPNSISIEGRTGWKSGKTNEGGGGGISS